MSKGKSKLDWCFENEKRMKKVSPNKKLAEEHIKKAKHNLSAADFNMKGGFEDWSVSQFYYAMYHSLLAVLFWKGYESKNHECTLSAVEYLIKNGEINLELKDVTFIRTTQQMTNKDAKSLREEFQYGTTTEVNIKILKNLAFKPKELVEKIEVILNEF